MFFSKIRMVAPRNRKSNVLVPGGVWCVVWCVVLVRRPIATAACCSALYRISYSAAFSGPNQHSALDSFALDQFPSRYVLPKQKRCRIYTIYISLFVPVKSIYHALGKIHQYILIHIRTFCRHERVGKGHQYASVSPSVVARVLPLAVLVEIPALVDEVCIK